MGLLRPCNGGAKCLPRTPSSSGLQDSSTGAIQIGGSWHFQYLTSIIEMPRFNPQGSHKPHELLCHASLYIGLYLRECGGLCHDPGEPLLGKASWMDLWSRKSCVHCGLEGLEQKSSHEEALLLWTQHSVCSLYECLLQQAGQRSWPSLVLRAISVARVGTMHHLCGLGCCYEPSHSMWLRRMTNTPDESCVTQLYRAVWWWKEQGMTATACWKVAKMRTQPVHFFDENASWRSGFLELFTWQLSLRCMQLDFNSQHAPAISTSSKDISAKCQKWGIFEKLIQSCWWLSSQVSCWVATVWNGGWMIGLCNWELLQRH